jgi:large subunit ribosomal protein L31e
VIFMADKLERIYTVPLGKAYEGVRTKRARRAVTILRQFLVRHMKPKDKDSVSISTALNDIIWRRSMQHPPRRVKIRTVKEDGKVNAYLVDEKPLQPKAETKKAESKKEVEKKPEAEVKKEAEKKSEAVPKKEATRLSEKDNGPIAQKGNREPEAKKEKAADKKKEATPGEAK